MYKYLLLTVLLSFTVNSHSSALSRSEIRATGKGMLSSGGFYGECGERNIIEFNRKAYIYNFFIASKYLAMEGIEQDAMKWLEKGKKGIIITANEEPEIISFSKETCLRAEKLIELQYELLLETISI